MKVALLSLQRGHEAKRNLAFAEPVHLVGMHNRLARKGIRSMVTDVSRRGWREEVRGFSPDIVGMTAPARELVQKELPFVNEIKAAGIPVIIGGVQATLDPKFYARTYEPAAIVLSQGEPVMDAFIRSGFNLERMKSGPQFKGLIENVPVFKADRLMPLDNIDYTRPYALSENEIAWPTSVFGCANRCVFCLPDRRVVFRSPDKFLQEVMYLAREQKAELFSTMGPDFAAKPSQANEIIEKMLGHKELMGKYYAITARIDSLAKAFRSGSRSAWTSFLNSNTVEFSPGIESFLPERLVRFGKYRTMEEAKKQREHLETIMDVLSGTKAILRGTLIMIDPESSLKELRADLEELEALTDLYPGKFLISEGDVFSFLRSAPGTRIEEMYEKLTDTLLRPRTAHGLNAFLFTLLTCYMAQAKPRAEEEYGIRMEGFDLKGQIFMHQDTTLSQIKTLRAAVDVLMDFTMRSRNTDISPRELMSFLNDLLNLQFPGI